MASDEVDAALMHANILCFDVLKMLLLPIEDTSLLIAAIGQAQTLKMRFSQLSNLKVNLIRPIYSASVDRSSCCSRSVTTIAAHRGK